MDDKTKKLQAVFYKNDSGNEPVRKWLKEDVEAAERKIIGADIATVEYGWPIGMPTCKGLGKGLWEVRSDLPDKTISRVLFMVQNDQMILLHGFIKKTQKTPPDEMAIARKRMKEVKNNENK